MRHQQVQAEWRRAQKALQAAELLQQNGLAEDAVSRAYYTVMHAAKAALLVHDVIADSHAAVRRLFGHVLVMAEGVEREWAQILARSHDQRGAAGCPAVYRPHGGLYHVQGHATGINR